MFTRGENTAKTVRFNLQRLLFMLAILFGLLACLADAWAAEEIMREAEDYNRCEERLLPPEIILRTNASGERMICVRALDTGYPTWLEYDFIVSGGLYEVRVRAGGNNSRQAGLLSLDGGPNVLIDDEPAGALPLDASLPADAAARSQQLEESFREHLVGSVKLTQGRHRIRITHAGLHGRSNAFGLDWIKLTSVESSSAPQLSVGNRPEPEAAAVSAPHEPVFLRVLQSYRFLGPHETPCLAVVLYNREGPLRLKGALAIELVALQRKARRLLRQEAVDLPRGEANFWRLELTSKLFPALRLGPGTYQIEAIFTGAQMSPLRHTAEFICAKLDTPGWAKRAATCWTSFGIGSDLTAALRRVQQLVEQGITCTVNANVEDWLGEEAISYPFRGDDERWQAYLEGVQNLGACHLMYHTMITVSEHFYYEHRDFWGGRKPFYHCSWLSIYPDAPQWNHYQAADFAYALRQYPLDGFFLDNACASGMPEGRTEASEAAIARHQHGLRAAIKGANPIGILYPNYNTLSLEGLRIVSSAWDAHMLEGYHPAPQKKRSQLAWTVQHFVTVASRVLRHTGKPFWPLLYTPSQYTGLGIAACAAAQANPVGLVNGPYLRFWQRIREYIYADDVFPMPEGVVSLSPNSPDLAATALVKLYPNGARDWIVQIVNGGEHEGKLQEQDVELELNFPSSELQRPAWLLRPEMDRAEPIRLAKPLKLRAGVWTVLIIAEELLPSVSLQPACLRPVAGETLPVSVQLHSWTEPPLAVSGQLLSLDGLLSSGPPQQLVGNKTTLKLCAQPHLPAVNRELLLRLRLEKTGREIQMPVIARVRPRLAISLHPNHFSVFPDGRPSQGQAILRLKNHSRQPLRGSILLQAPKGWKITAKTKEYNVAPGTQTEIPCTIQWPEFRPESLYDLCDAQIICRTAQGQTNLSLRLHMPATWLIYCPLGTKPRDIVRNGANPEGGAPVSSVIMTVRGHPFVISDAQQAIQEALVRQRKGEQRVVLWFRTGSGQSSQQLADPRLQALLQDFLHAGGGIIWQENVFRDSEAHRTMLLPNDICPIGEAYEALQEPGGDWLVTESTAPAIRRFARLALEGRPTFGLPKAAQPLRVRFSVKPWAQIVACNEAGDPVIVVSWDPQRPVAYLAGSLEGTYMDNRYGIGDYPEQMSSLLYFYAELARWLSVFGTH